MNEATLLFANLGAEEPASWQRMSAHLRVRSVARLWAALFPASARLVGPGAPPAPRLAGALARAAGEPAFPFCAPGRALVPWLATREAEALARAEAVPLAASPAEVVRRVHDKAFAHEAALAASLLPEALVGTTLALEPGALADADADAVRCRIEDAVAGWPASLRESFVLKPRLGTSGRGRLAFRAGRVDPSRLGPALARLREGGGALLEPWLERTLDLSAQLHVAGPEHVRVLGTLRQVLTRHGGPTGHAGRIGDDGAVDSGTHWDAELRVAALAIGRAAARAGFRGACGVDALVFRSADGAEALRPVVELNARFTAGTVALGFVARALRADLAPGARAFYFGFPPEGGAWPERSSGGAEAIPLLEDDPTARLCLGRDERALADTLSPTRRSA
ncbi:MAG: hypothetical protein WEF50_04760 [Myxococcota bacterium]